MNNDPASLIEAWRLRLIQDLHAFATSRRHDVARGAETPELAALLIEKYGSGLAKAAQLATDLLECPPVDLMAEVDRLVLQIDPNTTENRQKRWSARPAGLSIG